MRVFLPSSPLLLRNCTVSRSTSSYPFQLQSQGPELRLRVTANSIVMQRASTRIWKSNKNGALARSTTSYMGSATTTLVIFFPVSLGVGGTARPLNGSGGMCRNQDSVRPTAAPGRANRESTGVSGSLSMSCIVRDVQAVRRSAALQLLDHVWRAAPVSNHSVGSPMWNRGTRCNICRRSCNDRYHRASFTEVSGRADEYATDNDDTAVEQI